MQSSAGTPLGQASGRASGQGTGVGVGVGTEILQSVFTKNSGHPTPNSGQSLSTLCEVAHRPAGSEQEVVVVVAATPHEHKYVLSFRKNIEYRDSRVRTAMALRELRSFQKSEPAGMLPVVSQTEVDE